MTLKIERDKTYLDREDIKWRILCLDSGGKYPVIGYDNVAQKFCFFDEDGQSPYQKLVSEVREPREFWIHDDESCIKNAYHPRPLGLTNLIHVREVLND